MSEESALEQPLESSLEEVDQICPICTDTCSLPVKIQKIFKCDEKCRQNHRYCLTCLRDSFNLNGAHNGAGQRPLENCPFCRAGFTDEFKIKKQDLFKRMNWNDYYEVDDKLITLLDEQHGKTDCPRNCDWTGLRKDVREHLKTCPNSFSQKCQGCMKLFTLSGLVDHLKTSKAENTYCYRYNPSCGCGGFIVDPKHISVCPYYRTCEICQQRMDGNKFEDHIFKCSQEKIQQLETKVKDLDAQVKELSDKIEKL